MSWEGYNEYICDAGHYFEGEAYSPNYKTPCPVCGGRIQYVHTVDTTNGSCQEDDPSSFPGEKTLLRKDDKWLADHYGNKYALQIEVWSVYEKDGWRELDAAEAELGLTNG